jgi:mannose-6-phosphate isomerase
MNPILFERLFFERIWGGNSIEKKLNTKLPLNKKIGESWDIVDRDDAQSVVKHGIFKGWMLKDLRLKNPEIFGKINTSQPFSILVKILDAQEDLSLQVHPPKHKLHLFPNAQSKNEFWYVLDHNVDAKIIVGLKNGVSPLEVENNLQSNKLLDLVNVIDSKKDLLVYVESGLIHCIGAGNLILEVQENSDTTYRVSDWGRVDSEGKSRQLHIQESMECIDFDNKITPFIHDIHKKDSYMVVDNSTFTTHHYYLNANNNMDLETKNVAYVISNCGNSFNIGNKSSSNSEDTFELKFGDSALLPANTIFNIKALNQDCNFLVSITKI